MKPFICISFVFGLLSGVFLTSVVCLFVMQPSNPEMWSLVYLVTGFLAVCVGQAWALHPRNPLTVGYRESFKVV